MAHPHLSYSVTASDPRPDFTWFLGRFNTSHQPDPAGFGPNRLTMFNPIHKFQSKPTHYVQSNPQVSGQINPFRRPMLEQSTSKHHPRASSIVHWTLPSVAGHNRSSAHAAVHWPPFRPSAFASLSSQCGFLRPLLHRSFSHYIVIIQRKTVVGSHRSPSLTNHRSQSLAVFYQSSQFHIHHTRSQPCSFTFHQLHPTTLVVELKVSFFFLPH